MSDLHRINHLQNQVKIRGRTIHEVQRNLCKEKRKNKELEKKIAMLQQFPDSKIQPQRLRVSTTDRNCAKKSKEEIYRELCELKEDFHKNFNLLATAQKENRMLTALAYEREQKIDELKSEINEIIFKSLVESKKEKAKIEVLRRVVEKNAKNADSVSMTDGVPTFMAKSL